MAEFALVGKDVEYAQAIGGTSAGEALVPHQLAAGSIGAYAFDPSDGKYKLVVSTGAGTGQVNVEDLKNDAVTFFLGLGGNRVYQSESHQIKGIRDWKKSVYEAPTKQEIHIGSNGTTGNLNVPVLINQGLTDALIRLKEIVPGYEDYGNTYNFDAGKIYPNDTDDTVADKLVAAINNHPSGIATASKVTQGTNRGVKIEINKAGVNFNAVIGGVIETASLEYTSYAGSGSGTLAEVAAKEQMDRIYRGDFYSFSGDAYKIFKNAPMAEDVEYDVYWLRSVNESADKTGQKATVDHEVKTWIALPDGAAQTSEIEDIVSALLAGQAGPQGPQGPEGPQGPQG